MATKARKRKAKLTGTAWADITAYNLQIGGFKWRTAKGDPVVEINLTGLVIGAGKLVSIGAIQFYHDSTPVPFDQAGWSGDPPDAMSAYMRLPLAMFDTVIQLLDRHRGVRISANVPAGGPTQITLTQLVYTPV